MGLCLREIIMDETEYFDWGNDESGNAVEYRIATRGKDVMLVRNVTPAGTAGSIVHWTKITGDPKVFDPEAKTLPEFDDKQWKKIIDSSSDWG